MTSRVAKPDTPADRELRDCLDARPPRSFIMVAGAGSGKTTSLVKALATITHAHGPQLRVRRQRVACITYTEVASAEIWADVGNSPLAYVSTIHSFLWSLVRPFQADIRRWVMRRIQERIDESNAKVAGFTNRVQAKTRAKAAQDITRYQMELARIVDAPPFTYGTGSNYPMGILGHHDIIEMVPQLLVEKPLLRRIVSQQFPIVFVDESQDTMPKVVAALIEIQRTMGNAFCLGFFGDPMQKIYTTGIGRIDPGENWSEIKKPENFRCAVSVLNVANNIRRDDDRLEQIPGSRQVGGVDVPPPLGTARLFVLPADASREVNLARVRSWLAHANGDEAWHSPEPADVKVLVIAHRMAATRLGFANLYAALNNKAPSAFKDGFEDASAWPLHPLWNLALPLADALLTGRSFEAMAILRRLCPRLERESLRAKNVAATLAELRSASQKLAALMDEGSTATMRDLLEHIRTGELIAIEPRLIPYLDAKIVVDEEQDEKEASAEVSAMEAFLKCPASELWGYAKYVNTHSPFSTQHGVKGAEFNRVLVILDDEEGRHNQFSYEKYFGLKPLSDTDRDNIAQGKDSVVERTRRLFYVCCTRALSDLAVVLLTNDPEAAAEIARGKGWFAAEDVRTLASMTRE